MRTPLTNDPLLRDVPEVEGYKVLPPVVLYAKVGVGGMGAVYRGRHMKLDIDVAVKCLKPSLAAESEAFVSRFQHEARVTADITHENLIRIYDVSEQHGLHYLVLEYVDGETARARVKRKGPLQESEAATIVLGAARGLAKAHRHPKRIVHRDIKPENILVSRRGEVKLADLGIAKSLASSDGATFSTQGIIGTPQYMAPEQWSKRQKDGPPTEVGPHTDVWAFGSTLHFLLTGENAFPPGDVLEIGMSIREERFPDVRLRRADVSPALASILARCTEKDPKLRYVDAAELARALEQYLGETVASLVDRDSGTVPAKESLVSPPPAHTLKRIKVQVESTGAAPAPAQPQKTVTTPGAAPRPQPRTRPDTRRPPSRSPGPSKSLFLWAGGSVLLLALLILGWKAFHKGEPVAEKDRSEVQVAQIHKDLQTLDMNDTAAAERVVKATEEKKALWVDHQFGPEIESTAARVRSNLTAGLEKRAALERFAGIESELKKTDITTEKLKDLRRQLDESEARLSDGGAEVAARFGMSRETADKQYSSRLLVEAKAFAKDGGSNARPSLVRYQGVEDELKSLLDRAFSQKNKEMQDFYTPLYKQAIEESDRLANALFQAEGESLQWTDCLAPPQDKNWIASSARAFSHDTGGGVLRLIGPDSDSGKMAVISIGDREQWRHFQLDVEFTVEKGDIDLFFRLGRGPNQNTLSYPLRTTGDGILKAGKKYSARFSVIGSKFSARFAGEDIDTPTPRDESVSCVMNRKGAIGFVIPPEARANFTRFKVRELR